ncbi:MAG: ABC transporter ATP-binding protein [Deltaproteobacteria bacterium]|nr:ABC transporter ATP-binding protein [Deltaproteobacteria bacterium]
MENITLKNVTKRFGKTTAVDNVSLEIKAGSLFFLLGPSGCGKTTLLRMVAGFCEVEEGDIFFGGSSVKTVPPGKRNTALVFQNYALWPHLNVHRNVAYGLEERRVPPGEIRARVREALASVRMEEYEFRKPNELSGGQQQRVALARALVVKPDAVLLDEPLSNLDARLRMEMREEIRRIHDETGVTMIYVTHDQKEALTMADEIAVMSMGRVEQIGAPQEIYRSPANIFVATFLGDANLIQGELIERIGPFGMIRTPLGVFTGRLADPNMRGGDAACCMVRPENLRLSGAGENRLPVIIKNTVFLGEAQQYLLQAGSVSLKALAVGSADGVVKGKQAEAAFTAADALLLPAEGEGCA